MIAAVSTAARVDEWRTGAPPGAVDLDALCRQIDVRHTIAAAYGPDWQRLDPETPADAATVAGVVAVLLTAAEPMGTDDPGDVATGDAGRGLKYTNSALKALELAAGVPDEARLRAWALRLLDDRTRSDA